eukprot:10046225-Lingulodinium_polyedra.AAC.1
MSCAGVTARARASHPRASRGAWPVCAFLPPMWRRFGGSLVPRRSGRTRTQQQRPARVFRPASC